ncbi:MULTISPECIES: FeoA family protein [Peribacillus]|uniref:Ferrous iron transport protein A n=1 Tax=Peribacillus deserti TaxID=673318 RepID=A0A2N5M9X3_9BACI|nr:MULTISPECIES: FeoA family protein [Peribacillus]PLT31137.1 ferrous iron transport protein A [Peribacillus deserti]
MVLTELQPGGRAKILDIEKVNVLVKRRLLDLGVIEGTEISIKRILPFGGPFALEAGGQSIGIRRKEAKLIQVEVS